VAVAFWLVGRALGLLAALLFHQRNTTGEVRVVHVADHGEIDLRVAEEVFEVLGALEPGTGEYIMLGKTFKGLTDALLEWQTHELLAREIRRDEGTVYVRPELVVEIAFSDLQASTRYPGGFALRLARVKRYREDKRIDDADTMQSVRKIYASQQGG